MKKTIYFLLTSLTICTAVSAQSLEDGIKFINYEKFTSAKQALQKVVAGNPKDARSIYWLGQAYIGDKQVDSAKVIYQNALNAGVNDPWIWIGVSSVEILQNGNMNAIKQRFEQAITATTSTKGRNKGPNADILNAVGRANALGNSNQGDPNYGIDKLKQAAQIDPKNPDIDVNLGLCYLKLGSDHGGDAFEAFRQATVIDPTYARAFYRIGRVYQSQRNLESMNEWYTKAIAADATFPPVYYAYFEYYEEKDINVAKQYLDKYVANADKDCATQYFVGNYLFRAGKYQEALQQAKQMESGSCRTYSRLNVLYAYSYDRLGDSLQARSYIQKFLSTAEPDAIQATDYALAGNILAKFPDGGDSAISYLQKAITLDTVKQDKIDFLDSAAKIAASSQNYRMQLQLTKNMEQLNGGKLSELQYYTLSKAITDAVEADSTATTAQFDSSKYALADSVMGLYIAAYPDKPQGYSFKTRFAKLSDRDTTKGLAVPAIMEQNAYLAKDTSADAKKSLFANDYYLLIYYAEYATDLPKADEYRKAIDVATQMTQIFPDTTSEEYQFADKTRKQLQASLDKFQQSKKGSK